MTAPATHSPEWHGIRSQGIGASEIATVAGIGRWGSRWEIWATKTGLVDHDHTESEAQRSGTRMEATLAAWFCEDTGLYVAGEQMMVSHPDHPWMRATLDGLVFEGPRMWVTPGGVVRGCHNGETPEARIEDALGPLQLKETSDQPWTAAPWDRTIVPADLVDLPAWLAAQVQWEIAACGDWCERAWVGAKHPYGQWRIYEVSRDEEGIAALFAEGHAFWFDHVLPRVPPPLGGPGARATAKALGRAFGEGGGGETDVTDLADQLASLRLLKAEAKAIDEQIEDLSNVVKAGLGDAEVGLIGGQVAVTWRRQTSRRLDVKRHRAERPDCDEEFASEGSERVLLVKGASE